MAISDRKNQNLMNFIRKVHGVVENVDLEKHRQSQDHFGVLLSNSKDVEIREFEIEGIHGEWTAVNRAHMKKYIILYCHGGGYSTGSSVYARTLTTKFAMSTSMDVLCFDYRLAPENPYPAATEDAMKIWNYLMLLGYGARDIIIAGDSAGGNLALSLVLKLKEKTFAAGTRADVALDGFNGFRKISFHQSGRRPGLKCRISEKNDGQLYGGRGFGKSVDFAALRQF